MTMEKILKTMAQKAKEEGISYRQLQRRIKGNKVLYYKIPNKVKKWFE